MFFDKRRTGRHKRGTQLRDHMPVDNLSAMTIQQNDTAFENRILNGQEAAESASIEKTQESEEQSNRCETNCDQNRSVQRQSSDVSDEYQRGSARSRRTGNKSARGSDSRHRGAAATDVREKSTAGSGSGRRSEVTRRPVRNETRQLSANQLPGPTVARTIYTSDRRMNAVSDSTAERLSSSNTVSLTVMTG